MPYRRLPNTDQARMRALTVLLEKEDDSHGPVSYEAISRANQIMRKYKVAHDYYITCYETQKRCSRKYQAHLKMARLYLSHFIQVLNLSVIRGEIKVNYKSYYGLTDLTSVPDLSTENAILTWGKLVIDGERKRTMEGGIPIYNPTIAKVKVHYDLFVESSSQQKNCQRLTASSLKTLSLLRPDADKVILDIWNQIELAFNEITPEEVRLEKCRNYGVVYYYRSSEKRKNSN